MLNVICIKIVDGPGTTPKKRIKITDTDNEDGDDNNEATGIENKEKTAADGESSDEGVNDDRRDENQG